MVLFLILVLMVPIFSEEIIKDNVKSHFGTDTLALNRYLINSGRYSYNNEGILELVPTVFRVSISGNYPLLEERVLKQIDLFPGQNFKEGKLGKERERLLTYLSNEGFINPTLEFKIEKLQDGYIGVDIEIEKDGVAQIDSINIVGNSSFSSGRILLMMESFFRSNYPFNMNRFSVKVLENDIKVLKKFYKEKGFYDSQISHRVVKRDDKVDIHIDIDEGLEYELLFDGSDHYYNFTLSGMVEPLFIQSGKDMGIKRSVLKLKEEYKLEGFDQLKIKTKVDSTGVITFKIDEGKRKIIDSFNFTAEGILKERISPFILSLNEPMFGENYYSSTQLSLDSNSVAGYMISRGYNDHSISIKRVYKEDNHIDIEFKLISGSRGEIKDIIISGNGDGKSLKERIYSKEGEPFLDYVADKDRSLISSYISEEGYPYVSTEAKFDTLSSTLNYRISKGSFVKNGEIFFSGNFKTDRDYLISLLEFEEDSLFSLKRLYGNQKYLRKTALFKSVKYKTPALISKMDRIDLFVELYEKPPYFLDLNGKYDSETEYSIGAKGGDNNFMGMNRALYADLFYSQSEESYKLIYEEKNLFNYFIQSKTSFFYERIEPISTDEWYEERGVSLNLSKKFGALTVGVGSSFSLKNSDTYKGVDNYLNSYSGFVTYDKRSNLIRPKYGYYGNFTALNSLNFTEDYDKFIKFEFDNRGFYTLGNLTFALAMRNGYISSQYEDLVSTDQLFLLGGTTTIRGYAENLAYKDGDEGKSGFEYSLLNFELRLETLFNIETIGFYDMGSLGSLSFDEYKSSYGGGLGYITPFGSITLYYGMKVDPVEGEDDGRWHFSIGYVF